MNPSAARFVVPGRILAEGGRSLRLTPHHMARHMFVAGGSGGGKTKLLELLCRHLVNCGVGFTFVDPHGQGADAVMRYLAVKKVDAARVHYLKPGLDTCFSFDPFARPPARVGTQKYESWLIATIDRITEAFLRNVALADQEMMKRLKRWLGNVLYVAGVDVGGKHLGLADARVMTRPQSDEFRLVLAKVGHALHPDVRRDFEELAELKSGTTRNQLLESTMNLLRDELFTPVIEAVFSQGAPSIDMRAAVLGSHYQLINLQKTGDFSRKHRTILGGILINFLIHEAETIADEREEEDRVPHVLIIDEAENFIGEDIRMGFAELRKFRLGLCLAFQDLGCLKKGDLDLVGKVISQCGLQMTFQQGNPEDTEYLGKAFGYGNLDFTPLMSDTVLPDGYDWVDTESVAEGENATHTEARSSSTARTEGTSRSRTTSESIQESVSRALSASHTEGQSASRTEGRGYSWSRSDTESGSTTRSAQVSDRESLTNSWQQSTTDGVGKSEQQGTSEGIARGETAGQSSHPVFPGTGIPVAPDRTLTTSGSLSRNRADNRSSGTNTTHNETAGQGVAIGKTQGATRGVSEQSGTGTSRGSGTSVNEADTRGKNSAVSTGETNTASRGTGRSQGQSEGTSASSTASETTGASDAVGRSRTVTRGKTPLARHRIVRVPTGSLVRSVQDQLAEVMNRLASLPDRTVLVKCKGLGAPFLMQVHDVLDPYDEAGITRSPGGRVYELSRYLDAVRAWHGYYFVPPVEREDRVGRFLRANEAGEPTLLAPDAVGPLPPSTSAAPPSPSKPEGASGFIDD